MTDGEPSGRHDEKQIAYDTAKALKNKDVLIVGAAIGDRRQNFKRILERITTTPEDTFDADFNQLDTILNKLVDKSCKPLVPGKIYSLWSGSKLGNKVFLWPIIFRSHSLYPSIHFFSRSLLLFHFTSYL